MGIRQLFALFTGGNKSHRPRIVRAMAPHTMKQVFDKLYGVGQWCVVVDEAYYRLYHNGSKTDNNLAIKGVREATDALEQNGVTCVLCPEGKKWKHYWDSTRPDSQPVAYRGTWASRPKAQFSSEAAVRAALPHLATVAPDESCGEVRAARLLGTTVQGKIAVAVVSGDSDCFAVARYTAKPVVDTNALGGVNFHLYDREAMMGFHGIKSDGLAFFAALGSEFAPSREAKRAAARANLGPPDCGRTGLGPCALSGLLGIYSVTEITSAISFVNGLEGSETVFEWFRAVVDGDEEFPEADDDDEAAGAARDIAVAIAARIADRGRMTTSTDPVVSAQHHELVKDELFAFARYLYDEIESHTSWNIPFDESVWDYT